MRVRFAGYDEREQRKLAALDAHIEHMFAAAADCQPDLSWWRASLQAIDPALDAEWSADAGLVVRSDVRGLCPLVERIVARAPIGTSLSAGRPGSPLTPLLARIQRTLGVDLGRARVRVGFGRGHLLDVVLYLPGGTACDEEQVAAEELVWGLLGERRAHDWIGGVDVAPVARGGPLRVVGGASEADNALPLSELVATIDAASSGLHAELPRAPAWATPSDPDWTLFELEPEPRVDWPAQDDLLMTTTCVPELLKCYLEGASFSSVRFSRHAERFFHLKYEASGSFEARHAQRIGLEDRLDAALRRACAGAVVGGGLGLRYAYVDLALGELDRSVSVVRDVGREQGLPLRSWLQPFDTDWQDEWVELHADAPPPPPAISGVVTAV